MKEYLSTKPIWHESTEKISALDGKSILIARSDNDITPGQLRVETALPNSLERGKVSVIVGVVIVPDEPWQPVTMNPTAAQKVSEIGRWSQFLSQDALDLIRPQNDPSLPYAELLLALPDDAESGR